MTDLELHRMSLEALCDFDYDKRVAAITALRERLAQPEQKPVAWFDKEFNSVRWRANLRNCDLADQQPLYTTPPRREWVGLTEEEWIELGCRSVEQVRIGLAIEAKLKEKNAP